MSEPKKTPPKRQITEQDVERIMQNAPDYILDANDEVKDLYVASEWAKEERDLSPKRYYDIILNESTEKEREVHIDFQQVVNPGAVIKTNGGSVEDVRRVNGARLSYLNLDRVYNQAVLQLNKAMGIRSRKPRNIVDYTGTIMELFGKFYTITDVAKVMAKEYRIKVPEDELKKFYVENRDLITRRRADYVLNSKDFRVATEAGRLEVLNQLLIEAEIKNRASGGSNVELSNLIIKILEQARKEVKGNELKMTVDGKIDINATLHAELNVTTVMRQLSINSIVIGLTAAKSGLNPSVLIAQLANSWYSKFNGFNGNIMDGEEVMLPSALIKSYDWDKMEKNSQLFIGEFKPITEIIDEQDGTVQEVAEDRRAELLKRLKDVKTARAKEMDRANPYTSDAALTMKDALEPEDTSKEPKREFEIDYALNKRYPQKKGMRVKGAIGESIARHKAAREENEILDKKAQQQERRKARRIARKQEIKKGDE